MGGAAGAVLVRDCNAIGYAESILGFPGGGLRYLDAADGRVVPTMHLSTCNCAYRREAIEAAGGFSPLAALGAEDSLLAERVTARWPCRYVPAAAVYHKPRQRLGAIFHWFVRRGRAEMLILPAKPRPAAVVASLVRGSTRAAGARGRGGAGLAAVAAVDHRARAAGALLRGAAAALRLRAPLSDAPPRAGG